MKWPLKLFIATILLAAGAVASILVPKFRNMKSEYGTAEAIHDLTEFVEQHDGRWPASPAELGGKYPANGDVLIDYATTSSRLMANRSLLPEAVRPRSGKFYTYPHYEEKLDRLYAALLEANASE
jgi:glutamate 5-kinase